jgi:aminoglycoside phosphotransferase (APT) family kinase protein
MCEDDSVIGVPFYLMDFVDGIVYSDTDQVAHLNEAQALAASNELIDVLARLHAVDFEAVGLGQLGKPAGFLERQVNRWCTQWEKSKQRELPAVDEVAARLKRSIPAHTDASIVHGDYSFNNTMWSRSDPTKMVAVLDWEMSTLGDPLTDLGMVSVYWGEAGALMWRSRSPQPHRLNPGFPVGDHLLARYEATSGRSIRDIDVYRVLAVFKLSIITEGALARIKATRPGEDTTGTENTIAELAELALEMANSSPVASLRGA